MKTNAHSPLSLSSPKDGETLDAPPIEIVMDFKSPAKLIKVELLKKNKQGNSFLGGLFGGDDGETVPLGKSFLMSMNKRQISNAIFGGGRLLTFMARNGRRDGHVIKGELTFKVGGT